MLSLLLTASFSFEEQKRSHSASHNNHKPQPLSQTTFIPSVSKLSIPASPTIPTVMFTNASPLVMVQS